MHIEMKKALHNFLNLYFKKFNGFQTQIFSSFINYIFFRIHSSRLFSRFSFQNSKLYIILLSVILQFASFKIFWISNSLIFQKNKRWNLLSKM